MPTAAGYTAADRGAIPASGRSERLRRGRCQVRTDFEPSVPRDTTKVSEGSCQARQRFDALKANPKWFRKLMSGDAVATAEYERLNRDLAG